MYTDRYYTSLPLAKELMQMKCHLTAAIQTNRKAWKDKRIVTLLSTWNNTGMTSTTKSYMRGGSEVIVSKPNVVLDYIHSMGRILFVFAFSTTEVHFSDARTQKCHKVVALLSKKTLGVRRVKYVFGRPVDAPKKSWSSFIGNHSLALMFRFSVFIYLTKAIEDWEWNDKVTLTNKRNISNHFAMAIEIICVICDSLTAN
uniref:PiggyBac transposable element-derived protein domain-containing protein n=1 Tax=Glossina palpalis gambiensis TaxID=67801 RepID=A0A1B0AR47_9MUSC